MSSLKPFVENGAPRCQQKLWFSHAGHGCLIQCKNSAKHDSNTHCKVHSQATHDRKSEEYRAKQALQLRLDCLVKALSESELDALLTYHNV